MNIWSFIIQELCNTDIISENRGNCTIIKYARHSCAFNSQLAKIDQNLT